MTSSRLEASLAFGQQVMAARGLRPRLEVALERLAGLFLATCALGELELETGGCLIAHPDAEGPVAGALRAEAPVAGGRLRIALDRTEPDAEDQALLEALTRTTASALGGQLLVDDLAALDADATESGPFTLVLRRGRLASCHPDLLARLRETRLPQRQPGDVLHALAQRCQARGEAEATELPRSAGGWLRVFAFPVGEGEVHMVLSDREEGQAVVRPLPPRRQLLSARELEVACLAAGGLGNAGIAHRLRLSPNTVKLHLRHACAKMAVRGRAELATRLALEGTSSRPEPVS